MPRQLLWTLVALLSFSPALAQVKYEKEYGLDETAVPQKARDFISQAFPEQNQLKWYKEENIGSYNYEAKLKYKRTNYSIEFDSLGNLEDVEFEIKKLPGSTRLHLDSLFSNQYDKWKIKRIQVQWVGAPQCLIQSIQDNRAGCPLTQHYEIILHTKLNKSYTKYEILTDPEGHVVRERKIIDDYIDNIIY